MWPRGILELQHWPGFDPVRWLAGWQDRIQRGDAVAFGSHAILGWDFEGPGVINTSFQASKSFEEHGRDVTKELRREIPRLMVSRKVSRFNTYSLCVSPESERWFRLLGLTEDTQFKGPECGPFLMRRFFRSA